MAWIEGARGIFRLHDSDLWCGSLLPVADVVEILQVEPAALPARLRSRADLPAATKALFGDFTLVDAETVIVALCERFRAAEDGLGYMYGNGHTPNKPEHPVVDRIRKGRESPWRLIPRGATRAPAFWLPAELPPPAA